MKRKNKRNYEKINELSEKILLETLRQSFEHWRHIENMRQGFTAVWGAIVAGVLAFISQNENPLTNVTSLPAIIFLVILTSLGLLMSIRLGNNIKACESNIKKALQQGKLGDYDPTTGWGKGITSHFRLRRLFNTSYLVALIFLIALLIIILASAQT